MFSGIPSVSDEELKDVIASFGIKAVETSQLPSERDFNVRVVAEDGRKVVLKLSMHDSLASLEAQNALLDKLSDLGCCPKVVKNLRGEGVSTGPRQLLVRMLTYEPGTPIALLPKVRSDPEFLFKLGELAARMDTVLEDFDAPALHLDGFMWDMCNYRSLVQENRSALESDPEFLSLVDRVFAIADAEVAPILATLPRSIIHGDLNPWNILYSEEDGIKLIG